MMESFGEYVELAPLEARTTPLRLDPRTGLFVVALWCCTNAVGYLGSEDIARRPLFAAFAEMGIQPWMLGGMMIAIATALLYSIVGLPGWGKSLVAMFSAALLFFYGTTLVISGRHIGVWSPSGMFSILCAAMCSIGCLQWVFQE